MDGLQIGSTMYNVWEYVLRMSTTSDDVYTKRLPCQTHPPAGYLL